MDAKNVPDNKLMWYVIIHMTFVLSAFAMGTWISRPVTDDPLQCFARAARPL